MNNKIIKKVGASLATVAIAFTMFFGNIAMLKVDAATVDDSAYCSGTSSYHTLNSAIANVCGPMSSGTSGYIVGNTSEWMCVSPNMSAPVGQYGRVESRVNTNNFNAGNYRSLSSLESYSVSQVVYGCCAVRSSNWGMAHAVLSYVVNGDTTWLSKIVNGGMDTAVRSFASQVKGAIDSSGVPRNNPFYVFIPDNRASYQMLVNTSYTPPAPSVLSVNFNKTNSNGAAVSGAVIRFTGTSSAAVSELTCNISSTPVTNGIEFTTNGSQVVISGLQRGNTYTFHEVSAPAGFTVASDITITVSSAGRITSSTGTGSNVTMVDNEERVGSVVFHKKALDANGNNLQGAVMVFSSDTPGGMSGVTYVAGSGVSASRDGDTIRFITGNVNDQITINGLHPGATYRFHEEAAPEGYIAEPDQTFTVGSDGSVPGGGHITFVDGQPDHRYGSMRFFKNVDPYVEQMMQNVYLYIYEEGFSAPFVTLQRGPGQSEFGCSSGMYSAGQLSDASHVHFYSDGWSDANGDHPGMVDWVNPDWPDMGAVYWCTKIEGLPEAMYTIEEDWIVGSFVDLTTQERYWVDAMNVDGMQRLPDWIDDDGNLHVRFRGQVRILYTGGVDEGLNHSVVGPNGIVPNYGAIQINNSEASFRFDLTKIQRHGDCSDLSFQLWSMNGSIPRNHIANGAVTTSATSADTYSVNWTYQLLYPGASSPTTLRNVDYINHLPLGRYQLREYASNINAYSIPEGWERITDSTGTYFAITLDFTNVQVGYNNHPMEVVTLENRSGMISIQKTDLWTGLPITNYEGTLSFDLYDNNNNFVATGIDLDKDGVVEFDLLDLYPNGNFPNTFYAVETSAPFGYYLISDPVEITVVDNYAEITVADEPYSTHLSVHKLDSDTNEVVRFAEFVVYEDTNADGIHQNSEPVASSFINGSLVEARVEFDGTDYVTTPLRSGHYIIVETGLPEGYFYCDANGEPTSTPNSFAFEVENRNTTVPNFVVTTYETTMFNAPVDIHTTLLVTETGADVAPLADSVELTDIVTFENLIVGEEFVLEGILMNKETGEPILDENGNPVTGRTVFIPETSDGTVEVSFTINTNFLFDGSNPIDVVCFETLKYGERIVKIHADINDDNQTIHIVKLFNIELTKFGEQFVSVERVGDRYVPVWEARTLSDATFAIYALDDIVTPDGVVRHVAGELIETITTDENGYAISSNLFLGAYRVVEIEAPINYVLGYDEIIVGEDRGDIALYTITAPECIDLPFTPSLSVYKTLMPGQVNGSNSGAWYVGDFGCVTFGIYANEDIYAPDGTIIPKDGLIEVISCNSRGQAISSVNFPYGSYYVRELSTDMWHYTDSNTYPFEYTRPSSRTEVNNIVSLGIGNSVVNTPENPSICTTMTYNGQHLAPANTVVSLVDRVWYENLKPWQQYEMHGTIMLVHEDGTYEEYMDVGPVVFSTTDIVSGYVDVPFEVDTTGMAGMNLVAFERLTHGSVTVAVHMDINADIQTIHIPSIGTTATVNSSHEFDVTDEIVLTDTVEFVNLIPGRTYRVDGVLMDKTYNTPLGVNGSMVTSSATFVPTSPNGTVEVTFRFDGSVLHNNQELVVFERVFDVETNTLVGRHEDFDSPSQTVIVRVPSPTPTPTTPNPSTTPRTSVTPTPTPVGPGTPSTGEGFNYLLMIGAILVVCGGFTIIRITTDKKLKNSEDKTEE